MQPDCSTIYDSQLQNTKVFRAQPQQRGTLTQPAIPLRSAEIELQNAIEIPQRPHKLQLQNRISQNRLSTLKRKNDDFEALCKRIFKRKIMNTKLKKKSCQRALSRNPFEQPWQSHFTAISAD
jgi:hypothetical protein